MTSGPPSVEPSALAAADEGLWRRGEENVDLSFLGSPFIFASHFRQFCEQLNNTVNRVLNATLKDFDFPNE